MTSKLLCDYGDPTCPCIDGDACYYRPLARVPGARAMTPPKHTAAVAFAEAALAAREALAQSKAEDEREMPGRHLSASVARSFAGTAARKADDALNDYVTYRRFKP